MRPSPDQFRLAADWLEGYEPIEDSETDIAVGDDMALVAKWLREQAEAADLRAACREAGVPVASARRALRQRDRMTS